MRILHASPTGRRGVAVATVVVLTALWAPPAQADAKEWRSKPTGKGEECTRGGSVSDSVEFKGRYGQGVDFGIRNVNMFGLTALFTQSKPSKNRARTVIFPGQTRWVYMSLFDYEPITYEWEFSTDSESRAYVWIIRSNNCKGERRR